VERKKKGKNDLNLGQELCIEQTTFEDLEDIRWNFLSPIKQKLVELVRHRKWVERKEDAQSIIMGEFSESLGLIPYRFTRKL
jgi:hypothetical protein